MTIILSNQDYEALFEEAIQNGEISYRSNEFETICEYPPQLAKGYRQSIQLRPGMELSTDDRVTQQDLILKSPVCQWSVGASFHLAGNYYCDCGAYVDPGHTVLTGSCIAPEENLEFPTGERLVSVDISIAPDLFEDLIIGQLEQLPPALKPIMKGVHDLTKLAGTITPSMQVTLQQILQCPYQGGFKRLYLEGKVLELMALQLMQVIEQPVAACSYGALRSRDVDCIHQAREILIQNLDNPPSLLDLARQVGLNDRKLKQGFHQVFNTTAFGYLRDCRLERAQQLLMDSEISIEQVAKMVGYGDRSRFASAFRKKFGVNPKTYQLQSRKEI
ncbi:helix-turn-helix transcriptional regulator [Leptolyngbyaceae cyanobacterium UHCC 1019]